jgi:phospho-N-acetylmuramoyl-pentapeptide-transferase
MANSVNITDGLDGLAGGTLAVSFLAIMAIAYAQGQIGIAAFAGTIIGALLAFLWFNVPPARFYMGETGMMGLTVTLTTIAFLTNSVLILPIIAMPLVVSALSVILQLLSRKFRGKRFTKASS